MKYRIETLGDDPKVIEEFTSKELAIRWLDTLLEATKGYQLLSVMNDIQSECNAGRKDKDNPLCNKFTFPIIIINLILNPHDLIMVEVADGENPK